MQDDKNLLELFQRLGHAAPSHDAHGTVDDIRERMTAGNPRNWRLEGNELYADTDHGTFMQRIPPNYLCYGTDEDGLPILRKIA